MTTTTVPTTISAEATAHVAELGMGEQFRQMLDHIRQTVTGLRSIDVILNRIVDEDYRPLVALDVWINCPDWENDRTNMSIFEWEIDTFPPEVLQHFCISICYE